MPKKFDESETDFFERGDDNSINGDLTTAMDSSTRTPGAGSLSTGAEEVPTMIGARETRQVTKLRIIVMSVLFVAAGIVSGCMYWLTKEAEQAEFETAYDGVAAKILESFEEIVTEKLAAISSMAVAATAYARSHDLVWPFVTMNDFHRRAATALSLTDALVIEFVPLISDENRVKWENYTTENLEWLYNYKSDFNFPPASDLGHVIHKLDLTQNPPVYVIDEDPGPYAPIWTSSPPVGIVQNFNLLQYPPIAKSLNNVFQNGKLTLGSLFAAPAGGFDSPDPLTAYYSVLRTLRVGKPVPYDGDPVSYMTYPVFDSFEGDRTIVAGIFATVQWSAYLEGVVPPGSKPVTVVLENPCDGAYTYIADNQRVSFIGQGDLHDTQYDDLERVAPLDALLSGGSTFDGGYSYGLDELGCPYNIRVYPTQEMEDDNSTSIPLITTLSVGLVFLFTAVVFVVYDRLVERRQTLVLNQATQSTAIVSSFFPEAVRERLMPAVDGKKGSNSNSFISQNSRIKSFLAGGVGPDGEKESDMDQPIADLFPFTTVLFADIAGFTAWSSTREPAQVFVLLQTVYQAFDAIAKRHKVFKVETIGDSYVAATGLPNEQPQHALLMARFAHDCLQKFSALTYQLEVRLGPDTADLGMRFGLHSGPVTAGVLRGERARFQLFGDTVNTAARMESTGKRNRIQVSHTTAAELQSLNKSHWLSQREDIVQAKGKGVMETWWLKVRTKQAAHLAEAGIARKTAEHKADIQDRNQFMKQNRLVSWCVEMLSDHLRRILARRQALNLTQSSSSMQYFPPSNETCLEQVVETFKLPKYNPEEVAVVAEADHSHIKLDETVAQQLHDFVAIIAGAYGDNPFHNFEHAMHVTMSVQKLLQRIQTPNLDEGATKAMIHDYSHGLTSDPLMMLAIVISALIHDVDHRGVGNGQLAKEDPNMADRYHNKSIAEQNSLDIAWSVLMGDEFSELRRCMFTDRADLMRFRQIIVNIVMATDIFDPEINALRKLRWEKAFGAEETVRDENLRATIVIEHIMQASDVAHTMQHWHVYRKWNERLFREMKAAFRSGRMAKDPADFWYQGELGFFDNYIIPLAKKLKDCNVFGVSSDECLNYAVQNRREWEQKGRTVVAELIEMTTEATNETESDSD